MASFNFTISCFLVLALDLDASDKDNSSSISKMHSKTPYKSVSVRVSIALIALSATLMNDESVKDSISALLASPYFISRFLMKDFRLLIEEPVSALGINPSAPILLLNVVSNF